MGSSANKGIGVIFEENAPHAPIAEITDLGEVGASRSDNDVTSHDSSNNAEEFLAGIITGGEVTMTVNLVATDTSGQMQAITDLTSGIKKNYIIRFPNTDLSTYQFYGYVKSYRIKSELKGVIKMTLVWKISFAPVFTA